MTQIVPVPPRGKVGLFEVKLRALQGAEAVQVLARAE